METIEPTTYVIAQAGVAATLVTAMCVNFPWFANAEDFQMYNAGEGRGRYYCHSFLVFINWIIRLTVIAVVWATWEFGRIYVDEALAVPNGMRDERLNASYETMNFVKFQGAWFTSIYTAILMYKLVSEMYFQSFQKGFLSNLVADAANQLKKAVDLIPGVEMKTRVVDKQLVMERGAPLANTRFGIVAPLFQALIFLLFLIPLFTNIFFEHAMFRDTSIPDWDLDTMNAPDPQYKWMVTTATILAIVGVIVYIFMQLLSAGFSCLSESRAAKTFNLVNDADGEDTAGRGAGVNYANIFNLANIDYRDFHDNPLKALFSWRGNRHDPETYVDGVEHGAIFGMADGSLMLASLSFWVYLLYVLLFDYTMFLLLRNNDRWMGYVITTNLVPLFFARVSSEGSSAFFEPFVACNMVWFVGFLAIYGWNYHLGVAGWDPSIGLGCPSTQERFCFYSIPGFRNTLSYADMSPTLLGFGFTMAVVVGLQVIQFAVFFGYDGAYNPGTSVQAKLREANFRLAKAKQM